MTAFIKFFDGTYNDSEVYYCKLLEAILADQSEKFVAVVANEIVKYRCQGAGWLASNSWFDSQLLSPVEKTILTTEEDIAINL